MVTPLPDNQSSKGEGRKGINPNSPFPYSEVFEEQFPYYLAIGMSAEQYWDGDSTLPKYYRKAEEIRMEKINQQLWLQGMYIYDAIGRLTPILHAFAKKGAKPLEYVSKPYPISDRSVKEERETKEKATAQKGLMYMQSFMSQTNKRFEERK